jgi:hypothetical protein
MTMEQAVRSSSLAMTQNASQAYLSLHWIQESHVNVVGVAGVQVVGHFDTPANGWRQPHADGLAQVFPTGKALCRIPTRKIAASQASRLHAVLGGLLRDG